MHHNCHVKSASVCLQRLRACAAAGDFTRTKNGRSNCVAVVLPIALGAAVAASATILKAKCTLIVGANECAPACARNKGPLAPHVDLRDDAEKRAEEKAETAAHVQLERAMMREQQVALSATAEPRKSEQALAAAPPAKPQGDTHRRLVDDLAGTHRGLHSTGSVFVSSVDSSNASSFFLGGSTPFKALLITEVSVTPQWFKALASKHHGICAFGEARCTDTALMKMLGVFHEALPLCIVVTAYPEAVRSALVERSLSANTFKFAQR
jgi:hypothetical protein